MNEVNELCTGSQWRHLITAVAHEVVGRSSSGDIEYRKLSSPGSIMRMGLSQFRNTFVRIKDTRPIQPAWETSAKMVLNWAYPKHKALHDKTPYTGSDLLAYKALCGLVGEVPPDVAADGR